MTTTGSCCRHTARGPPSVKRLHERIGAIPAADGLGQSMWSQPLLEACGSSMLTQHDASSFNDTRWGRAGTGDRTGSGKSCPAFLQALRPIIVIMLTYIIVPAQVAGRRTPSPPFSPTSREMTREASSSSASSTILDDARKAPTGDRYRPVRLVRPAC